MGASPLRGQLRNPFSHPLDFLGGSAWRATDSLRRNQSIVRTSQYEADGSRTLREMKGAVISR